MKKPNLTTWRRTCQIFIAVAFIIIPIVNRTDYSYVYGNYLSFHLFGIPFADPLAVLQLTLKNFYLTPSNVIGTLIPLLLAFTLGTVFCSWLCVYGLLSELTRSLGKKIMGRGRAGMPVYSNGFFVKLGIFALGLAGFFVFSTTPILNQLSVAAWYSRFFQYLFGQDTLSYCFLFLLALLLIEFIAGERLWCRYICPQSVLIILAKQFNRQRLQVAFAREKCICKPEFERCDMACHLNLKPKTVHRQLETECSNCGDCVVACEKMGKALSFEFEMGRKFAGKVNIRPLVQGLRKAIPAVLCLAVLVGGGYLALPWFSHLELTPAREGSGNRVLNNKKISWQGAEAQYYELLENGTLICVGGDWPLEGFKGWSWEPIGENGSFKMTKEASMPGSYTVVRVDGSIQIASAVKLENYLNGIKVAEESKEYVLATYETLIHSHEKSATVMDARATIDQYADQVYIQELQVLDPGGKKIKKILTSGDLITTEGMLTAVHRWISSPAITASEGRPPDYPIHTSMELRFHDGGVKKITFVTDSSKDRSDEVFEDMWF